MLFNSDFCSVCNERLPVEKIVSICIDCHYNDKWISVKDRLPEENHLVLFYSYHDCIIYVGGIIKDDNKKLFWKLLLSDIHYQMSDVSHWMPLPMDPK